MCPDDANEMLSDHMTPTQFILFGILTLPIFFGTERSARFLRRLGQIKLSEPYYPHLP
jgi:hypothetical protein